MKKLGLVLLGVLATAGAVQTPALAQVQDSETFSVSAVIPAATGITFTVSEVTATSFTVVDTTNLTFDVTLDPDNGVYLPSHIYAIDVGTGGGAGTPDIGIEYTDLLNPNDAVGAGGLGVKGVATAVKVSGAGNDEVSDELVKATLEDINGEQISGETIFGGFFRLFVGLATGNKDSQGGTISVDPDGAEPFTNADQPGTYSGTLVLTATID